MHKVLSFLAILLMATSVHAQEYEITATWECPAFRADTQQTPFDCETELEGYRIYHAPVGTNIESGEVIDISPLVTTHTFILDVAPGTTYQFAMDAIDKEGLISELSNTVSHTFSGKPAAPGAFTINVVPKVN
jgi:hypothetical protein